MAVVIDEAFFARWVTGLGAYVHLSIAEIAWVSLLGYDPKPGGWKLVARRCVHQKKT